MQPDCPYTHTHERMAPCFLYMPTQTYNQVLSPLCLCDYCPRAYHVVCLGPAAPARPNTPGAWQGNALLGAFGDFSRLRDTEWACPK